MNRLFERIIGGLVLLFAIVYGGYQAYRFFASPLQTETVFQYTQSNSVQAQGIAIRDEIVLPQNATGIQSYTFDDGARVSVGETIAEFYSSSVSDQNIRRIRELQQEIAMLQQAQDKNLNNYANVDILNRNIRQQLVQLADMSSRARYAGSGEIRANMLSLLNRKQVAIGRVQDYSERIAQLEEEYGRLEPQTARESILTVEAPESGYFSKTIDGYEHTLSYGALKTYTLHDYENMLSGALPRREPQGIGRMVRSQRWAFVALMPKYSAEWLRAGQTVSLYFESVNASVPATVQEILQEQERDNMAVVFVCEYISDKLINLRLENVVVRHQSFTGLRIDTAHLRFQGWVFQASLPSSEAAWMRAGQSVRVQFASGQELPARLTQVDHGEEGGQESETTTILLTCHSDPGQQVAGLAESATLVHDEVSEQPASSIVQLTFQGEVQGVYVLEGREVRFKAVDPIYEESGFILSRLNYFDSIDKQHVRLYDQVITGGSDLYDGKVVR